MKFKKNKIEDPEQPAKIPEVSQPEPQEEKIESEAEAIYQKACSYVKQNNGFKISTSTYFMLVLLVFSVCSLFASFFGGDNTGLKILMAVPVFVAGKFLGNYIEEPDWQSKAMDLYRQAMALGHVKAKEAVIDHLLEQGSDCYYLDEDEAKKFYKEAANLGSSEAMYRLGELENRYSLTKNTAWYEKAARLGHIKAQKQLAVNYSIRDKYKSYLWYYVAGLCGDVEAEVKANVPKSNLDGKEIIRAEEEARKIFDEIQKNKEKNK